MYVVVSGMALGTLLCPRSILLMDIYVNGWTPVNRIAYVASPLQLTSCVPGNNPNSSTKIPLPYCVPDKDGE